MSFHHETQQWLYECDTAIVYSWLEFGDVLSNGEWQKD